jgi:hypothetical protein
MSYTTVIVVVSCVAAVVGTGVPGVRGGGAEEGNRVGLAVGAFVTGTLVMNGKNVGATVIGAGVVLVMEGATEGKVVGGKVVGRKVVGLTTGAKTGACTGSGTGAGTGAGATTGAGVTIIEVAAACE